MATEKSKKIQFSWTEEETALLLKIVLDYKVSKLAGGQDWETVRTKYEDITSKLQASYPKDEEERTEFPHLATKAEFTKERLTAKIEKIKTSFRKAIDSGSKSGGGRVVYELYDDCYEIWAGCPAAESISNGIETASVNNVSTIGHGELNEDESSESSHAKSSHTESSQSESFDLEKANKDAASEGRQGDEEDTIDVEPLKKKMKTKRDDLSKVLSERRNCKSTKKISFQDQMLEFTKEDMAMRAEEMKMKRRLVDQFESSERHFNQSMEQFSAAMSRTMAEGFSMLRCMFQQSGPMPPMQFQPQGFTNEWCSQNFQEERQQNFQQQQNLSNEPT